MDSPPVCQGTGIGCWMRVCLSVLRSTKTNFYRKGIIVQIETVTAGWILMKGHQLSCWPFVKPDLRKKTGTKFHRIIDCSNWIWGKLQLCKTKSHGANECLKQCNEKSRPGYQEWSAVWGSIDRPRRSAESVMPKTNGFKGKCWEDGEWKNEVRK